VPASLSSRRIRRLRPPKGIQDPSQPAGAFWEDERVRDGGVLPVLTVLLTGAECRFSCVYCDLWRATLNGPTPSGAVPQQIRATLHRIGTLPAVAALKLYNHSNYFDARAVPPGDDADVLSLVAPFTRVTVECHPTLIGRRCLAFAERMDGALEVAMGLETADPAVLERLNKRMTLEDFDRAAETLRANGIGIRAFVLVSPPFVAPDDAVTAAVQSVEYAFARGVQHVSLIPVRGGNGAMEGLERAGVFVPPRLSQLEDALEQCLGLRGGVVTADLWDARSLASCGSCGRARLDRLARMNLTGRVEPRVACSTCETH
jgi:radical SAM enzyme (TIGR01210 family)